MPFRKKGEKSQNVFFVTILPCPPSETERGYPSVVVKMCTTWKSKQMKQSSVKETKFHEVNNVPEVKHPNAERSDGDMPRRRWTRILVFEQINITRTESANNKILPSYAQTHYRAFSLCNLHVQKPVPFACIPLKLFDVRWRIFRSESRKTF